MSRLKELQKKRVAFKGLDTKLLPVVGYKLSKRHSDFEGSATYGYCASRKLNYFGYKLVMLTMLSGGVPLVYDLVPAHPGERAAAETLLGEGIDVLIFNQHPVRNSFALT